MCIRDRDMALATERKRKSLLRTELEWLGRGARARSTKQKACLLYTSSLPEAADGICQTGSVRCVEKSLQKTVSTSRLRHSLDLREIKKDVYKRQDLP